MNDELKLRVNQAEVDVGYLEKGISAVIDKQVQINHIRAELDMFDENEVVYVDDDGRRFVQ